MKSKIGIIIPCYNEAKRLQLDQISIFLEENEEFKFIFANDGSKDNTEEILKNFCLQHSNRTFYFTRGVNMGKAEIIRNAALEYHTQFEYIGYFDADFSTPLSELKRMGETIEQTKECQLIMGCRHQRLGVRIERSTLRHYLGRIFATLASISLDLNVYDTQCGAKIMSGSIAAQVFKDPFLSKWFFDVEILKRLLIMENFKLKSNTIIELPLNEWIAVDGSKVKMVDFLRTPAELLKIHLSYPRLKIANK